MMEEKVKQLYPNSHVTKNQDEEYEVWSEIYPDCWEVMGAGLSPEEAWFNSYSTAVAMSGKW